MFANKMATGKARKGGGGGVLGPSIKMIDPLPTHRQQFNPTQTHGFFAYLKGDVGRAGVVKVNHLKREVDRNFETGGVGSRANHRHAHAGHVGPPVAPPSLALHVGRWVWLRAWVWVCARSMQSSSRAIGSRSESSMTVRTNRQNTNTPPPNPFRVACYSRHATAVRRRKGSG